MWWQNAQKIFRLLEHPAYPNLVLVKVCMSYPLPLQVLVIWHPDSDSICRPLAEKSISH